MAKRLNNPWHPQLGKLCLSCGEEDLHYKYFDKARRHWLECFSCKSAWSSKKEDDVKRQHKNGGAKKT